MKYNFDEIIDRKGTHAAKYDERKKKFKREDLIPLWIADMDFKTAQPIIDAMVKRAQHGIFGYVSKPDSYKEAAISFQKRRHNWDISKDEMSFAVGIVPALAELVREFTKEGDRVLIQTPVYPEFYEVVEAWEGRIVIENKLINDNGYYFIDFEDLEEKLKSSPKLMILCNPHNPVGRVWKKEELEKLGNLCVKYQVPLISDEIHGDLELFNNKYVPMWSLSKEIKDNTIVAFSATKTFNLAGLQACFIVFPKEEWKNRFDSYWIGLDIHRNNCFSLVAMETAWNEGDDWLDQVRAYIEENMKFAKEYIDKNIKGIKVQLPEATYLMWLDCKGLGLEPKKLEDFMVNKAGVALNNGSNFCRGLEGFMRMNVACPRSILEKALVQIKDAVEGL